MSPTTPLISGLDRAVADPALLRPGRVGLLTHFAAVTADLDRGVDALRRAGVEVACLISPEHGYWGTGQAGDGNDEDRDAATGLPVLDAYGKDPAGLAEMLAAAEIDQVVQALNRGLEGALLGEGPHVELIEHGPLQVVSGPVAVTPGVCREVD